MNTLEITRNIMRNNGVFAKKHFGQNFLVDDEVLFNIVSCSNVGKDDLVIEVGPGLGNLTAYILDTGAKVIAFEIDKDMIQILDERFGKTDSLKVINKDILKVNLDEYIENKKIKIIANLPYYITTPIIFKLLEYKEKIESITIMVQKEVADRITATPKGKDYGILTINTNYMAETKEMFDVPNTSFIPSPKITSAIVKIVPNKNIEEKLNIEDKKVFEELVKKSFSARRKKLANSLLNCNFGELTKQQIEEAILKAGLNTNCRAEEISIEKYAELSNILTEYIKFE